MKTVTCRQITLGEGRPKICVPITARTLEEVRRSVAEIASCSSTEIVEWRADWYIEIETHDAIQTVMEVLRSELKEIPILFTFRSKEEGGEKSISLDQYSKLVQQAIQAGADLIDIELSKGNTMVQYLIEASHKVGVPVIVSSHDFKKTPGLEAMMDRLLSMYHLGADICKLAVMPENPLDTLRLLEATWRLKTAYPEMLLITMSMSARGSISRVCGEVFGSVLTFGTVGKASAPGQIEAEQLKRILEAFHIV